MGGSTTSGSMKSSGGKMCKYNRPCTILFRKHPALNIHRLQTRAREENLRRVMTITMMTITMTDTTMTMIKMVATIRKPVLQFTPARKAVAFASVAITLVRPTPFLQFLQEKDIKKQDRAAARAGKVTAWEKERRKNTAVIFQGTLPMRLLQDAIAHATRTAPLQRQRRCTPLLPTIFLPPLLRQNRVVARTIRVPPRNLPKSPRAKSPRAKSPRAKSHKRNLLHGLRQVMK